MSLFRLSLARLTMDPRLSAAALLPLAILRCLPGQVVESCLLKPCCVVIGACCTLCSALRAAATRQWLSAGYRCRTLSIEIRCRFDMTPKVLWVRACLENSCVLPGRLSSRVLLQIVKLQYSFPVGSSSGTGIPQCSNAELGSPDSSDSSSHMSALSSLAHRSYNFVEHCTSDESVCSTLPQKHHAGSKHMPHAACKQLHSCSLIVSRFAKFWQCQVVSGLSSAVSAAAARARCSADRQATSVAVSWTSSALHQGLPAKRAP